MSNDRSLARKMGLSVPAYQCDRRDVGEGHLGRDTSVVKMNAGNDVDTNEGRGQGEYEERESKIG